MAALFKCLSRAKDSCYIANDIVLSDLNLNNKNRRVEKSSKEMSAKPSSEIAQKCWKIGTCVS